MSSTSPPVSQSPRLLPPYLVVLLLTAIAAIALAAHSADVYHAASAERKFPREVTRPVAFGLAFSAVVAPALLLAWVGELAAAVVWLARRRPAGRVLARFALAAVPCLVLIVGHHFVNPWLPDLLRQLRQMFGG